MGKRRADGKGSITWDASVGQWVARLPRDERGRREKVTGKTKKEALDKLRKRLREREAGMSSTAGQATVRQYLEGWVRD